MGGGTVGLTPPTLAAPPDPPRELRPTEEGAGGDGPCREPPAPAAQVCWGGGRRVLGGSVEDLGKV